MRVVFAEPILRQDEIDQDHTPEANALGRFCYWQRRRRVHQANHEADRQRRPDIVDRKTMGFALAVELLQMRYSKNAQLRRKASA